MISREDLYTLMWAKPMTKVAVELEVAATLLPQICAMLKVPRPVNGYWSKLAVGKAPETTPLPVAQPGDQLTWSRGDVIRPVPATKPATPRKTRVRAPRVGQRITGIHALVRDAKPHFESGRPVDEGEYFRPYKKLLVDVTASKTGLDKALAFANDLYNALESVGCRVGLAPQAQNFRRVEVDKHEQPKKRQPHQYDCPRLWSPCRPTVVYVGAVAIGLAVIEMCEDALMRNIGSGKYIRDSDYIPPKTSRHRVDYTWTTTRQLPTGRLRLIAYSPYWSTTWSTSWQETKNAPLTGSLPSIVKAIERAAAELVEKLEEADRQAEIARLQRLADEEKRRQEDDRRRIQQSIKDSRAHFVEIIQAWSEVIKLERFFEEVQVRAMNLPVDERDTVLGRLKLARDFVGTQDPMDFFRSWRSPSERYRPSSMQTAVNEHSADLSTEP